MVPKYHPTCHRVSLTLMTKLVAFFDMAFGLFGLVWFVIMLARYSIISLDPFENLAVPTSAMPVKTELSLAEDSQTLENDYTTKHTQVFSYNHKVISLSLVAFYTSVNLAVFVLLIVGVYRRSSAMCLVWFYIRCAIFVFKLIILVMYVIGGRPMFHHIPFIFSMIIHLYGLWVVNSYVDELKGMEEQKQIQEIRESAAAVVAAQEMRQHHDIYEVPNGIEILLQERLKSNKLKHDLENI